MGVAALPRFAGAVGLEAGGRRALVAAGQPVERQSPSDRGLLIAGPIDGLHDQPAVYHYAPLEHALERRAELSDEAWAALARQLRPASVLVGLTSIHWRESWKYGERAFRYCQHDVGHAIGAWPWPRRGSAGRRGCSKASPTRIWRGCSAVDGQNGPEAEHADACSRSAPRTRRFPSSSSGRSRLAEVVREALGRPQWHGAPNRLSPEHQPWPVIDEVAAATRKTRAAAGRLSGRRRPLDNHSLTAGDSPLALRPIIHQRRSAVALDGTSGITRDAFFQILLKIVPGKGQIPFTTLPWRPRVDLLLFVHRVEGSRPASTSLLRDPARKETLRRR